MIEVFFETERPKYAERVALFASSEIYNACLPALEKLCKEQNFDFVSESVHDHIDLSEIDTEALTK